jgi:hypothetical protein
MTITRLVQFLHPGGEHGRDRAFTSSTGWKNWNCGEHKRKFLLTEGSWTRDPGQLPIKDRFTFWGQWEPQSEVRSLGESPRTHHPRWLHTPCLKLREIEGLAKRDCPAPGCAPDGPQATDPLVFGDRFRYVVCLQYHPSSGSPTELARLQQGDIVLFGSHLRGLFVLDTVFVVGIYTPLWKNGPLPSWESELHRKVTMDLFDIPPCGLRLYGGEIWSPEKPFSFVPCLPVDGEPRGFPRPVMELTNIIKPSMMRGFKISRLDGPEHARAIWDAVVQQVLSQGCALGTTVDERSIFDDDRLS